MARRYFGTDGIRGRANDTRMNAELALRIGMAAGTVFAAKHDAPRVVIGKDTRLSGYMLESALVAGFSSVGMHVFQLGPMPTPAVAMLTKSMRADLGVMISASHNPFEDNGIKLFGPDGYKLSDEVELRIEELIDGSAAGMLAKPAGIGRAKRIESARERYIEFVKRSWPLRDTLAGVRIVVDCANGAAYKVAPQVLWELGAEVIPIGVEPNGTNINSDCGSTAPRRLSDKVRELRADMGIALDGDADRVIVVDETGAIVDGDQLIATIATRYLADARLANNQVVATVMSNLALEHYLAGLGIALHRTKVGDRYVVEEMRRLGSNVGGEQSGHIVLSDFATTGDGLLAALQILASVVQSGKRVSEVCRNFDPVPQVMQSVRCSRPQELEADDVRTLISKAEARLAGIGRLLIRPSGTEPVIRVMAEGDDRSVITTLVSEVADAISRRAA